MELQDRIRALASKKGISLPNLESELGFGNSTIVKWGIKTKPNAEKLDAVAEYFNVTMDYLMGKTKLAECPKCGQKYNPLDEFDCAIHDTYHDKILKAQEIYPTLIPYNEAVQIKAHYYVKLMKNDLEVEAISDMLDKYLKSSFALYVYETFEPSIQYDYSVFCKSEVAKLIEDEAFSEKTIEIMANLYNVPIKKNVDWLVDLGDMSIIVETHHTSPYSQIKRIMSYLFKLSPKTLDNLEIQVKALAENENPESTGETHE